jgi:hypothetical protein
MRAIVAVAVVATALIATPVAAEVHVGINIGIPAPPAFVVPAPPRLVVVPTTPAVRYAPDLSMNYFFYGDRYYTFHEGAWFMSPSYGGPWEYVERVRVPRQVLIVPSRYYRVPPGHARRVYRHEERGEHGHGHDRDDHDRGRGHDHDRGRHHHD